MSIDVKTFIIYVAAILLVPIIFVGFEVTDSDMAANDSSIEVAYEQNN